MVYFHNRYLFPIVFFLFHVSLAYITAASTTFEMKEITYTFSKPVFIYSVYHDHY